ncbi:MAG: hypothetical protein ACQET5_08545 [Halobacteriota archaeon]|uniref:hypothetical protein n=1 Tax=Natronomonas sp. TaxID=2184060 RepID=UPI0039755E06
MTVFQTPRSDLISLRNGATELWDFAAAKARHVGHIVRYGNAAPRPYELLWVDPADIEYCTLPSLMGQLGLSKYGSHVVGGDWDRRPTYDGVWYTRAFDPPVIAPFETHALYRSMRDHFEAQIPWEETEWYRWIERHPGVIGQYPTVESTADRLARVDELFEFIRSNGYQTQRELEADAHIPLKQSTFPCPEHYEIDVNIGRSGELFFNFNGRHRLAIAKILELDRIPVRIFARHSEWQRSRATALETSESTAIPAGHTDVKRLVPPPAPDSSSPADQVE